MTSYHVENDDQVCLSSFPFRDLYEGSVPDSPARVNVFRQYDELRLSDIGGYSTVIIRQFRLESNATDTFGTRGRDHNSRTDVEGDIGLNLASSLCLSSNKLHI
jgi:hypothetical protein